MGQNYRRRGPRRGTQTERPARCPVSRRRPPPFAVGPAAGAGPSAGGRGARAPGTAPRAPPRPRRDVMEFQGASANSGGEPAGRALERGASGCRPRPSASGGRGGAQVPPLPSPQFAAGHLGARSRRGSRGRAAAGGRGGASSRLRENGRGERRERGGSLLASERVGSRS